MYPWLLYFAVVVFAFGIGVITASKLFNQTEEPFVIVQKGEEIRTAKILVQKQDKLPEKEEKEVVSASLIKCGGREFNLVLINEYSERARKDLRRLSISQDGITIKIINSPEYAFIEKANKSKDGFEISVEYGSRYYYEKRFDFICKQNNFYLNQVRTNTFDKANPETSWKEYNKTIKPNLQLKKFLIDDFTAN